MSNGEQTTDKPQTPHFKVGDRVRVATSTYRSVASHHKGKVGIIVRISSKTAAVRFGGSKRSAFMEYREIEHADAE